MVVGRKKERFFGLLILSIGLGIMLAIILPRVAWIFFSAILLICAGVYLLRKC